MRKNKYEVFISCTRQDRPSARELAKALKSKGVSAWMESRTQSEQMRNDEMEKALRHSNVFLFFLSRAFLTSTWQHFELGVALSRAAITPDTKIIPIALEPMSKKSLPGPLRHLKVIDANKISSDQAAERVVQMLEEVPVST